jgi:hypothetical protein
VFHDFLSVFVGWCHPKGLPVGEQQALFDALKALGKPLTVVLINGRPALL